MTLLDVMSLIESTEIEKTTRLYVSYNDKIVNDKDAYKEIPCTIYNVLLHKDAKVVSLYPCAYADGTTKLEITIEL